MNEANGGKVVGNQLGLARLAPRIFLASLAAGNVSSSLLP